MSVPIVFVLLAASPAQNWKFKVGATPEVRVANIAGSIAVQGGSGDEVIVDATIVGEPSEWTVDVKQEGSEVHARACCGPCDSHSNEGCRSGKVDFVLNVPSQSKLTIKSVASEVKVDGVAGAQTIKSVSGQIEDSGSASSLDVHSVSGTISLSPKAVGRTDIHTVSGDVKIKLPANPDAKVQLSTVSGKLNGQPAELGKRSEASYGPGTVAMNIRTVSGSVETQPGQ
jgi:hypothetical protein